MRLKSVFVRFYKSFNYDYLRKIKADEVDPKPWEWVKGKFYPHVEVHIDPKITTVVGANESGKSHLLTAIEKGLTGESHSARGGIGISRKDFCRYSHFFKSTVGGPRLPDFGFEWVNIEDDLEEIQKLCGFKSDRKFDRFFLFRRGEGGFIFYIPKPEGKEFDAISVPSLPDEFLPHVFRIDSRIALPDSVPIRRLIQGRYSEGEHWQPSGRVMAFIAADAVPKIQSYLDRIHGLSRPQGGNAAFSLPENLYTEANTLKNLLKDTSGPWRDDELLRKAKEFNLAYDLIFKIAEIDVEDIKLLDSALHEGETGIIRSVVDNINEALRKRLNFPRIWAQDRNFALRIEATEHELSFIISDRTGREYSFDERSSGLRHFLSYYIQYLTHEAQGDSEILLMDEPDAFLSGEAQQDLLKVFQMFADPVLGQSERTVPVQVVYVTHSPFLIDKNHAERVRALEKAEGSKGTRVIGGAAQNHYEPLRSAFGAFVGETTFISGCNLMVEGPGDQILLAGAAAYLRKLEVVPESQLLDLNRITIVPAGGGTNVPYLVYLARGRDAEKPAVIVMLDSDDEGNAAKKDLSKSGPQPRKKQVLDPNFILQLGDISLAEVKQIAGLDEETLGAAGLDADTRPFKVLEDLVPLKVAVRAAREFIKTVYDLTDDELAFLNEATVLSHLQTGQTPFVGIQAVLKTIVPENGIHIDKVPFARTVVDLLPELAQERGDALQIGEDSGLNEFENNMRAVFRRLRQMQTRAEQDVKVKRMRQKVEEKIQTFLNDHAGSSSATRDEAAFLLADIESDLEGDDTERTFIVQTCVQLRAMHNLTEDLVEPVRDFAGFCEALEMVRNAKDYAYAKPYAHVPSLKKHPSHSEQEVQATPQINTEADQETLKAQAISAEPMSATENTVPPKPAGRRKPEGVEVPLPSPTEVSD